MQNIFLALNDCLLCVFELCKWEIEVRRLHLMSKVFFFFVHCSTVLFHKKMESFSLLSTPQDPSNCAFNVNRT